VGEEGWLRVAVNVRVSVLDAVAAYDAEYPFCERER
jgi:hypothetical protein